MLMRGMVMDDSIERVCRNSTTVLVSGMQILTGSICSSNSGSSGSGIYLGIRVGIVREGSSVHISR